MNGSAASSLTRESYGGIWAGVPTPWTSSGDLDDEAFVQSVSTVCGWGVAGVYTTGSTGEWYAVSDSEFERLMAALEIGRRGAGTASATQAGITGLDTAAALRRAGTALKHGADSLQVALPNWAPPTDDEVVSFFADLTHAFPGVPIVSYNTARCGRVIGGDLYHRLSAQFPEIVGAKVAVGDEALWKDLQAKAPELGFMVSEPFLATRMQEGARGSCSSWIYIAPVAMLALYAACREARWEDAATLWARMSTFETEAITDLVEAGYCDAAIDKVLAHCTGFIPCGYSVRPPYRGVPAEKAASLAALTRSRYEDFLQAP